MENKDIEIQARENKMDMAFIHFQISLLDANIELAKSYLEQSKSALKELQQELQKYKTTKNSKEKK